jgi:hypothetical protein
MADTATLFQELAPLVDREVVEEVGSIYQFDVMDEVSKRDGVVMKALGNEVCLEWVESRELILIGSVIHTLHHRSDHCHRRPH